MATTYNWGYTNTTPLDLNVDPVDVGFKTSYTRQKITDSKQGTRAIYDNRTTPTDLGEGVQITYDGNLNSIGCLCGISNPGKIKKGYQFQIRLDAAKRATYDSGDVVDSPLSVSLTVRAQKDGIINDSDIATAVLRLLGLCYDKTSQTWRFNDFMRNGLDISED